MALLENGVDCADSSGLTSEWTFGMVLVDTSRGLFSVPRSHVSNDTSRESLQGETWSVNVATFLRESSYFDGDDTTKN